MKLKLYLTTLLFILKMNVLFFQYLSLTIITIYEMLDSFNILCFKSAVFVLLRKHDFIDYFFSNLSNDTFFVFFDKSSMLINKKNVFKMQIPATSNFAVIDYKVQDVTYSAAVIDLRRDQKASSVMTNHRKFCFIYVQISKLQIFTDLQLLKNIKFSNIDNKPHSQLLSIIKKFDKLSKIILIC